jgi:hypothetical protein
MLALKPSRQAVTHATQSFSLGPKGDREGCEWFSVVALRGIGGASGQRAIEISFG